MYAALILMTLQSVLPGEPLYMADDAQHVKVHYEAGRFAGWPANHGMWNWGNEILVGYSLGYYKDLGATRHHIDREQPEEFWFARSLDGGETWTHEHPAEKGFMIPRGKFLHGTEKDGQKTAAGYGPEGADGLHAPGFRVDLPHGEHPRRGIAV
jgi:hypothetical protein